MAQTASEVRAYLPQAERPWDPRRRVDVGEDGRVPECYGRYGYGDGKHGAGTCHRYSCDKSDACYALLRRLVEATDSRAESFNERHTELARKHRAAGHPNPGNAAMEQIVREGEVPRVFEEAYLANEQLGRLDTGEWDYCTDCDRVVMLEKLEGGRCPRCRG